MKIWILGAKGHLGQAVAEACLKQRIPFVGSGREEVDVTDLERLRRGAEAICPTHLINCAAYTDVDGAEKNSKAAYGVNAIGAENVAIAAREHGIRVVHVSTDYVFDGKQDRPYLETDKPNPLGVYGKSKLEGELRVLDQLAAACIVRTSWIFGFRGKNFISTILSRLLEQEQVEADAEQINRATYNCDLAQALLDLSCHSGIFHFASGQPSTRYQIVKDFHAIAEKRKLPLKCQKISAVSFPSPIRPVYSALDIQKVSLLLGRKPRVWETVLGEVVDAHF